MRLKLTELWLAYGTISPLDTQLLSALIVNNERSTRLMNIQKICILDNLNAFILPLNYGYNLQSYNLK